MNRSSPMFSQKMESRSISHLSALESLRGLAILLVVSFHYLGILEKVLSIKIRSNFLLKFIAAGNTGVSLFFVLSGFLLTRSFISYLRRLGPKVNIWEYYQSRILRIIPAYYFMIGIAAIFTKQPLLLKSFYFVFIGFEAHPFSFPWWSLITEVQFYLILPWLMLLFQFRFGKWFFSFILFCWITFHVWSFNHRDWIDSSVLNNSVLDRGSAFLIGALSSLFFLSKSFDSLKNRSREIWAIFGLAIVSLGILMVWVGSQDGWQIGKLVPFYHDVEAVLWGCILIVTLAEVHKYVPLLIQRILGHFAKISYSLYLIHMPVQFYILYPLMAYPDISLGLILFRLTASALLMWVLALGCYYFIEQPFLQLKIKKKIKSQLQIVSKASDH